MDEKKIEGKEKQRLVELLELLGSIRGRHTELVSVLVPAGFNINAVVRQLEAEKSTAANIKSKQTRTAVIDALERIIRELKNHKQTPPNGVAIYCGNVSEKEGVQDIQLWIYEPPQPLGVRLYRCDQVFVLDPLQEMIAVRDLYGLLVIDRQQATVGLLEGKHIRVLQKLTSGVPGKIRAGGQSSQRFHRVTEGLAKEFFRRVANALKEAFFDMPKLRGILIGGPIPTKEEFLQEGELVTKLKEKIIAIKDIGYVDEHGLELLVEESSDDISQQELIQEKRFLTTFFETLGKKREMVVYGVENVTKALERGAVHTLFLSTNLSKRETQSLETLAENTGARVVFFSADHPDGAQFYNLTKGAGAILRFALA